MAEIWFPTVGLRFNDQGKLEQLWVTALGSVEWRPVEQSTTTPPVFAPSVAGVDDESEEIE